MTLSIQLKWQGPFGVATLKQRAAFSPPVAGGVYLWTVAFELGHRISYVGEAANLQERMYQHVFYTLGGAYCLYGDDHLARGDKPTPQYEPGPSNLFGRYLNEFDALSKLALKNIFAYRFFWAVLDKEREIRQAVESALITEARDREEPIQNDRRSRTPQKARCVHIHSPFPCNTRLGELCTELPYGELE